MKSLIFLCLVGIVFGAKFEIIEWHGNSAGMFSNLTRMAEWIYCAKQNGKYSLYLNMTGVYKSQENPFTYFFKPFEDELIHTTPPKGYVILRTSDYPNVFSKFDLFPSDGMKNFSESKYVYSTPLLYNDPDFVLFRERMHSIILQYLQPADRLQNRINAVMETMNRAAEDGSDIYKIGIHIRCSQHFIGYMKSQDQFLDEIERDIDEIMKGKNPKTTRIFLATLLEPAAARIASKYNVTICNIPRIPDPWSDWDSLPYTEDINAGADVIVDEWCLSSCDEIWGGASNT